MNSQEHDIDLVKRTIAATLRQISWWCDDDRSPEELRTLADVVASYDMELSCPMCQEVICDDDCPMYPIRV